MKTLRELRIKKNYSMKEISEYLKISKTYYWQIEHGQRRLSYDMAVKIATFFNTKPDKLFYDDIKQIIQ